MNNLGTTQPTNESSAQSRGHSLMATDRREITVKGVSEVLSFDETLVRLVTVCGILNLEGEGLRVHVLNLKEGIVAVTGRLNGVLYESDTASAADAGPKAKPRSRRLFG